jgi:two-component system, chemotaxis family, protein-glutamate methylesterase/glutaminase
VLTSWQAHGRDVAANRLIVIGASAGGVETSSRLLGLLSVGLPAAIVVVVHVSRASPGVLPSILARSTRLRVKRAEHGDTLNDGFVYVAPPDHHVLVRDGHVETNRGPRENRQRPAIDPLFRSAAVAYGPRAIGVVLTGFLDDGTAGLAAIKRLGGISVVQDPKDALFAGMPQSALERVDIDHRASLAEMGPLLARLVAMPPPEAKPPTPDARIELEARLAESPAMNVAANDLIGSPAPFSCPECAGPLWEVHDDQLRRYRCHTGHALTAKALVDGQASAIERSLWASFRLLEERAKMLAQMAEDERRHGRIATAGVYAERAAESSQHAHRIRALLEARADSRSST